MSGSALMGTLDLARQNPEAMVGVGKRFIDMAVEDKSSRLTITIWCNEEQRTEGHGLVVLLKHYAAERLGKTSFTISSNVRLDNGGTIIDDHSYSSSEEQFERTNRYGKLVMMLIAAMFVAWLVYIITTL